MCVGVGLWSGFYIFTSLDLGLGAGEGPSDGYNVSEEGRVGPVVRMGSVTSKVQRESMDEGVPPGSGSSTTVWKISVSFT